jgi:hypothetical protein
LFLNKIGYAKKFSDSAYGFANNSDLLRHIENLNSNANRWKNLDAKAILFWYRQSQQSLNPQTLSNPATGVVTPENPPMHLPGEILLMMDTEGRLLTFRTIPSQVQSSRGSEPEVDWTAFFIEAGLDPSQWTKEEAQQIPLSYADATAGWQRSIAGRSGTSARIEAAALRGKPVSFEIIDPWAQSASKRPSQTSTGNRISLAVLNLFAIALVTGGLFFARRNLRLGRGDRRNAKRLRCLSSVRLL